MENNTHTKTLWNNLFNKSISFSIIMELRNKKHFLNFDGKIKYTA